MNELRAGPWPAGSRHSSRANTPTRTENAAARPTRLQNSSSWRAAEDREVQRARVFALAARGRWGEAEALARVVAW